MKIAIIGNTPRAEALGRVLTGGGHEVVTSGVPYDRVTAADVIVLAVAWERIDKAVVQMGPIGDKVVIDAVNAPEGKQSGAEQVALKLNSQHVVEAFAQDASPGDPVNVCADDPDAKALVMELLRSCGFEPRDAGPLVAAADYESPAA